MFCGAHTFLADGRLFVAGGHIQNYFGLRRARAYNPYTNAWAPMRPTSVSSVSFRGRLEVSRFGRGDFRIASYG